jgi:glycosyltransferase involved in cell wall biosynthesis
MIRVLHVVEHGQDYQTLRSVECLLRGLGEGFQTAVRTIGPGGNWRSIVAAIRWLRQENRFDVVHAWGTTALTAAALGTKTRIVYAPPVLMRPPDLRWLRAVMAYRDLQVVCPTGTMQRAIVRAGVALQRCHVIRPGVDFSRINRRKDAKLRAQLGFAPDDYVLLGVGESTPAASHDDAVWATEILHVLDPRYKLLLWGRGTQIHEVKTFARQVTSSELLHVAEEKLPQSVEFEQLLAAADMILNTATGSVATLPLAICMAAALPIVSTVTYAASELLEDHHTAILVPRYSPRLIAQRVLELREDAALQWKISDNCRAEAYQFHPLTGFLDQYRAMYRQDVEGAPVEPPIQQVRA